MDWVDIKKQKPTSSGTYQVSPEPWKKDQAKRNVRYAQWDGIGFLRDGKYLQVKFWKPFHLGKRNDSSN